MVAYQKIFGKMSLTATKIVRSRCSDVDVTDNTSKTGVP